MFQQSPFFKDFRRRHVLLPVIHCRGLDQVKENASIAYVNGADGVFLINHMMSVDELLATYESLRAVYPPGQLWMGLNMLGITAESAMSLVPLSADGLWTDNACISENAQDPAALARHIWERKKARDYKGLYYGGFDFKGQQRVTNLVAMARIATTVMDVVTTSGPATGVAADTDKITTIRKTINSHPLGLASGVTPQNVRSYLPQVNAFLVSTGISYPNSDDFHPGLVKSLAGAIHSYRN